MMTVLSSQPEYRDFTLYPTGAKRNKTLDNTSLMSIIIFTVDAAGADIQDGRERSQTRSSPATRHSQSATPCSHRSAVCQRRLLRCQGSRPGQVRDASPGAERGPFCDWCRGCLRLLPTVLLSSAGGLRGGRACWPGPPKTRPQARAQADRRGSDLPYPDTSERTISADSGTGAFDPKALRNQSPSTKYRTPPAASPKKTPLNQSGIPSIASSDLTEQYEQLRLEATGRSEHSAQGLGLALFLRRGMAAWMHAWSQCAADLGAPDRSPRTASAAVPIDMRTQIATLLAGIILGLQQEATYDRNGS